MITGNRGAYSWIVWDSQPMRHLISAVPRLVIGKMVAITAADSGPFVPSAEWAGRGWSVKSGVAYSPLIAGVDELPHERFDEWYVFPSPKDVGAPEVFINYDGFRFRYYVSDVELHGLLQRFWLQLERLQPESYLAEGDALLLATRDPELYESALEWKSLRPK